MAKTHAALHELQMATACSADWEQHMAGTERVRRCGSCGLNAYRVSDLTRREAEELIAGQEGRHCPQLYRRQDGTVLARDCPRGMASRRKAARWWKERVVHLLLIVLPCMLLNAFIFLDNELDTLPTQSSIWDEEPFQTFSRTLSPRKLISFAKKGGMATPTPTATGLSGGFGAPLDGAEEATDAFRRDW